MKLSKLLFRDFFWIYFWLFQIVIINIYLANAYLMVLVALLFSTNIVIAYLDIQARADKVREFYFKSWEGVTDYFEKSENFEKWKLFLSVVRPKLKFANSAISIYAYLFYLFNVYLFAVYYLPILLLFKFKLPEIDRPYLLLLFLLFYFYEVFLTLYLKKILVSIDEKVD